MFQPSSSSLTHSSNNNQINPRENDIIAAEFRRIQQVRDEENSALMQLLGRQQQMAAAAGMTGSGGSNSNPSSSFNGNNSSGGNEFGQHQQAAHQQMSNFMLPQSIMNNLGMNMGAMGGMDGFNNNGLANGLRMNQQAMSMNGNMNGAPQDPSGTAPNAAPGNSISRGSSPQFEKVNLSSQAGYGLGMPQHQAFLNNLTQGNTSNNMNDIMQESLALGMNGFLQKNSASKLMPNSMIMNMPQNNHSPNMMENSMLSAMSHSANGAHAHNMPQQQQQDAASAKINNFDAEDPGWEEQYKSLRAYHLQFGNCKVPARFKGNPKLGRWVMTQRRQFTLLMQGMPSALSADRIRRLESMGFTWSVRPEPVTTWNKKFQELKAYKTAYGNCMVPQRFSANPQLGTWVHTQRRQYKLMSDDKKSSMTEEKVEALNSIGFDWDAKHISSSGSGSGPNIITAAPEMGIKRGTSDESHGSEHSRVS